MATESKWSWLGAMRRKAQAMKAAPSESKEEEAPWLALASGSHAQEPVGNMYPSNVKDPTWGTWVDAEPEEAAQSVHSGRGRWLSEVSSPYGFSDEDGTLKDIESPNWRRTPSLRRPKRFVARSGDNRSSGHRQDSRDVVPRKSGSTWVLQLVVAVVLTLCGAYAHTAQTPAAHAMNRLYTDAFHTDESAVAWPHVEAVLQRFHIRIPSSLADAAGIRFNAPMRGTIVSDYAPSHPRMQIQGVSGESVAAVASGTVVKVASLPDGIMVTVSHGSLGNSQYYGLAAVNVKTGETVNGGEVIGRLPNTTRPVLEFDMVKSGSYINPHDDIHFSSSRAAP